MRCMAIHIPKYGLPGGRSTVLPSVLRPQSSEKPEGRLIVHAPECTRGGPGLCRVARGGRAWVHVAVRVAISVHELYFDRGG